MMDMSHPHSYPVDRSTTHNNNNNNNTDNNSPSSANGPSRMTVPDTSLNASTHPPPLSTFTYGGGSGRGGGTPSSSSPSAAAAAVSAPVTSLFATGASSGSSSSHHRCAPAAASSPQSSSSSSSSALSTRADTTTTRTTGALPSPSGPPVSGSTSSVRHAPPRSHTPPPPRPPGSDNAANTNSKPIISQSLPLEGGAELEEEHNRQGHHQPSEAMRAARAGLQSHRSTSGESPALRRSIAARHQDLQEAVSFHIETLERALAQRDEELALAHQQRTQLEEDYEFNLSLIHERDEALAEATADLRRLYGEGVEAKRQLRELQAALQASEEEARVLKETVHRLEEEKSRELARLQREAAAKERFFTETFKDHERQMAVKAEEQHEHYMTLVAEVEAERARLQAAAADLTARSEASAVQQEKRFNEEISVLRHRLEQQTADREAAEAALRQLESDHRALERETALQQQRHHIAVEALQKSKAQERETFLREMDERIAAVDAALRGAVAGRQQAEEERARLSARVEALEKALAEAEQETVGYEAQKAQWDAERRALQGQVEAGEAAHRTLERRQKSDLQGLEEEASGLRSDVLRYKQELEGLRGTVGEKEEECTRLQRETQRLQSEVEKWKEEEQRTATRGKTNLLLATDRLQECEEAVEQLKEALREQQNRFHDSSESAQTELARVRRELHASEAARFALEEQLQLMKDRDKTHLLLEATRTEKEQLARRVMELEHINAEVRQQVATFTLELQNDPILKTAKENASQRTELQHQLLEAKNTIQVLQETLQDREQEVALLKARQLQSSHTPSATNDHPTSSPLLAAQHTALVHEHDTLRSLYEQLRRQMERETARRSRYRGSARRQALLDPDNPAFAENKDRSGSGDSATSGSTSRSSITSWHSSRGSSSRSSGCHRTSPPTPGGSTRRGRAGEEASDDPIMAESSRAATSHHQHQHQHRRPHSAHRQRRDRHERRHHDRRSDRTHTSATLGLAPRSSGMLTSGSALALQEAEVWRRKCLELEQHLQQMIQQRDAAQRQCASLELEKAALLRQVRSLTELNTFLKAQWREQQQQQPQQAAPPSPSPPHVSFHPDTKGVRTTAGHNRSSDAANNNTATTSTTGMFSPAEIASAAAVLRLLSFSGDAGEALTLGGAGADGRGGRADSQAASCANPLRSQALEAEIAEVQSRLAAHRAAQRREDDSRYVPQDSNPSPPPLSSASAGSGMVYTGEEMRENIRKNRSSNTTTTTNTAAAGARGKSRGSAAGIRGCPAYTSSSTPSPSSAPHTRAATQTTTASGAATSSSSSGRTSSMATSSPPPPSSTTAAVAVRRGYGTVRHYGMQ